MTVMQHSRHSPLLVEGLNQTNAPLPISKGGSARFGRSGWYMQADIVKLVPVLPSIPTAPLSFTGFGTVVGAAV